MKRIPLNDFCQVALCSTFYSSFCEQSTIQMTLSPDLSNFYAYILKTIGFLRNPKNRFHRPEKDSKCVQMLKKRAFNSKELCAEKPFSSLRNLKNDFVGRYGSFRVSYGALNGFVQNQIVIEFILKLLRGPYEILKDPYLPTKPFF